MKTTAALFATLAGLWLACGALEAIAQAPPLCLLSCPLWLLWQPSQASQ